MWPFSGTSTGAQQNQYSFEKEAQQMELRFQMETMAVIMTGVCKIYRRQIFVFSSTRPSDICKMAAPIYIHEEKMNDLINRCHESVPRSAYTSMTTLN
jgi:hypothetical protein